MSRPRPLALALPAVLLAALLATTVGCFDDSEGDDDFFGICDESEDCEPSDYCEVADCGGPGQCERRPTNCSVVPDPVCGCDDVTYTNECIAKQSGMDIESNDPCP